ncbi:hypothetical protein HPB47_020468 [Ixodes persulcatus]|uniref:Uncharacterized protein n=1 Tax=Ixodes persulcatus TaxID=34615 RepID=A0AC60QIW5_IXOPE|nr:hypothetical protein HPB47_020468 [Ixodes persulcatus]
MREENAMIRSELQQAKSLWTQLVRDAPKIIDRAALRAHRSCAGAMKHASSIVEDPSSVTGAVTDDGFQLVTRMKRRPLAKVGACANASLSSIPRPPVKWALFVTRLSPDTTCEDVNNYLSSAHWGPLRDPDSEWPTANEDS